MRETRDHEIAHIVRHEVRAPLGEGPRPMAPLGLTPILSFEEERVLCTMFMM
jgi:hypothetical protein